jgi:hypothetical protein
MLSGPATVGPPTLAAAPPAPAPSKAGRRRGRLRIAAAAAVAVAAAGGIATAVLLATNGGQPSAQQPQAAAPNPAISTSAPATSGTPGPVTPAPGDEAVQFMQNFYALLPGNTDAAWAQLSPSAQSASGGRAQFNSFYAGLSRVWLETIRHPEPGVVTATVVFTRLDGSVSPEPYKFVVGTTPDGRQVLESFTKASPT